MTDETSIGFEERERGPERERKCAAQWRIAIARLSAREKESQRSASGVLIIEDVSTGKAVVLLLIGGAIALAAYEFGRRSPRDAAEAPAKPGEGAGERAPDVLPAAARVEPTPIELGSTIEVPLGEELPRASAPDAEMSARPEPPAPPPVPPPMPVLEERRDDEPSRCLFLEATPNSVSAYGAAGPAIQLVVRARNGCATAFSGSSTYFRVVAAGPNGFPLASVNGRFAGPIPAFGTAETLVAITGDVTRVAAYRAELR